MMEKTDLHLVSYCLGKKTKYGCVIDMIHNLIHVICSDQEPFSALISLDVLCSHEEVLEMEQQNKTHKELFLDSRDLDIHVIHQLVNLYHVPI